MTQDCHGVGKPHPYKYICRILFLIGIMPFPKNHNTYKLVVGAGSPRPSSLPPRPSSLPPRPCSLPPRPSPVPPRPSSPAPPFPHICNRIKDYRKLI